jgi:hypothetical protein
MSAFLTPGNYTTYNTVAPSYNPSNFGQVGGTGKIGSALYQINQGGSTGDTVSFSHGIGAHFVVAADSNDTVDLQGGGWTKNGTTTDSTTGISGTVYKSGDTEVLVSGTNNVIGLDNANGVPTGNHQADIDAGINTIEDDNNGGKDHFVTKDEIQKAVTDGKFDSNQSGKNFWQGVIDALSNGSLKTHAAPDGNNAAQGINSTDLVTAENGNENYFTDLGSK